MTEQTIAQGFLIWIFICFIGTYMWSKDILLTIGGGLTLIFAVPIIGGFFLSLILTAFGVPLNG